MNYRINLRYAITSLFIALLLLLGTAAFTQPYYPNMNYGEVVELATGVTWQQARHTLPNWRIHIIRVDLSNRNIDLVPMFKQGEALERTSDMAQRMDAVAAVNAGFFNMSAPFNSVSYTKIDGVDISPSGGGLPLSVLGLWGNHNARIIQTKIQYYTPNPANPDWNRVLNAIGGIGSFVTANGVVVTVDTEGSDSSFNGSRHPRTVIGWSSNSRVISLITIDGRTLQSLGMTFTEIARLMADLRIERAINLDGGGSTTAWVKGEVVNVPSSGPGNERSVVSAWGVIPSYTIDNTDMECSVTGSWSVIVPPGYYNTNCLRTSGGGGANKVTWRPNLTPPFGRESGFYKVYAWWAAHSANASNAPYTIAHLNGTDVVRVDQTANGGRWNLLGTFEFGSGNQGFVQLSDDVAGDALVFADAVRFVQVRRMKPRWKKTIGDYPWFQNDQSTRGFAFNPDTGSVIAASYSNGGGVFALSYDDGSAFRLSGSEEMVEDLAFGSAATTHTGRIFATNIAVGAGTNNSRLHYWSSETASAPTTLSANAPARVGDYMDAYEDPNGNVTVLISGAQGSANPVLLRWYYQASQGTWTSSTIQTSGSPDSPGNKRLVTLVHSGGTSYEIWLKDLWGSHYRFSSSGSYLGTGFHPGTRINSNFYYARDDDNGQTVRYMAAGPYTSTTGDNDVILFRSDGGVQLESADLTLTQSNTNASGRLGIGAYRGRLCVSYGMTNNAIILYAANEPSLIPEPASTVNWHQY